MAKIQWHEEGKRIYETGVDHGVLYPKGAAGYEAGVPWNGLTEVSENPSGAEATPLYADNIKYLSLRSAEEFGATIGAYTYPDEFAECDGSAEVVEGVFLGQQTRKPFGLSYRTLIGNENEGTNYGYKIHLVYDAMAAPSQRTNNTVNDNPEASTLSWEMDTTPTQSVEGYRPVAHLYVDSTKVSPEALQSLEEILYGGDAEEARMPTVAEVIALVGVPTAGTP